MKKSTLMLITAMCTFSLVLFPACSQKDSGSQSPVENNSVTDSGSNAGSDKKSDSMIEKAKDGMDRFGENLKESYDDVKDNFTGK